jgi:hypothetical protein
MPEKVKLVSSKVTNAVRRSVWAAHRRVIVDRRDAVTSLRELAKVQGRLKDTGTLFGGLIIDAGDSWAWRRAVCVGDQGDNLLRV